MWLKVERCAAKHGTPSCHEEHIDTKIVRLSYCCAPEKNYCCGTSIGMVLLQKRGSSNVGFFAYSLLQYSTHSIIIGDPQFHILQQNVLLSTI